MTGTELPTLGVFLNHRYRSPDVNLRLFNLMTEGRSLQFEVDPGKVPANTTRLERMIRDADAFVAILSVNDDPYRAASRKEVADASRYFKLEFDMAVRARKPCYILLDHRFHNDIRIPGGTFVVKYRGQYLDSPGLRLRIRRTFEQFWKTARSVSEAHEHHTDEVEPTVGYLVPPELEPQMKPSIEYAVARSLRSPVQIPWPPCLDGRFLAEVRRYDWVIVECGSTDATPIVAFLRGQAIPILRTRRMTAEPMDDAVRTRWDHLLFGELYDHYDKNLVRWSEPQELTDGLVFQHRVVDTEAILIKDAATARAYFRPPPDRKERVFLSYASADRQAAAEVAAALRARFIDVFDYRDPTQIPPGSRWLDVLYERIAGSSVGVPLVSAAYERSNWCRQEAVRMGEAEVDRRMRLFPLLLDDTRLDIFKDIQDRKLREIAVTDFVDQIVHELDRRH